MKLDDINKVNDLIEELTCYKNLHKATNINVGHWVDVQIGIARHNLHKVNVRAFLERNIKRLEDEIKALGVEL